MVLYPIIFLICIISYVTIPLIFIVIGNKIKLKMVEPYEIENDIVWWIFWPLYIVFIFIVFIVECPCVVKDIITITLTKFSSKFQKKKISSSKEVGHYCMKCNSKKGIYR